MIFQDYPCSVTVVLISLDLPTLQSRRIRAKLMMYKIINGLVSIPKEYLISPDPNYLLSYKLTLTSPLYN